MSKTGFGNPTDPHRVSDASRRLFLVVLVSALTLSVLAYLFRANLLEEMGGGMLLFVTFSMSLGIAFAVYRAVTITMDRLKKRG